MFMFPQVKNDVNNVKPDLPRQSTLVYATCFRSHYQVFVTYPPHPEPLLAYFGFPWFTPGPAYVYWRLPNAWRVSISGGSSIKAHRAPFKCTFGSIVYKVPSTPPHHQPIVFL